MNIVSYEDIPLDQLTIGISQARVSHVGKNVDDLAKSIERVGLLEPIVVALNEEGKYEIITGQRRFLAVTKLGWDSIKAGVLEEKPSDNVAKAISLTENMVREDMSSKDYIDACTALFRHYGSIKQVSDELGLPYSKVQQYVKFDQLIPKLKTAVEDGTYDMKTALRAQKAASSSGDINEEMAVVLANEMSNMSGVQRSKLEQVAASNPGASVEEVLEAGRKQAKVKSITVVIADEINHALDSFALEEGTNTGDAAASLIVSGLMEKGYVDED